MHISIGLKTISTGGEISTNVEVKVAIRSMMRYSHGSKLEMKDLGTDLKHFSGRPLSLNGLNGGTKDLATAI